MQDLQTKVYDVKKLTEFRHWMHENAELSLEEFNTHKKIKEFGIQLGVPEEAWKVCAKTGWRVDIKGRGPPKGSKKTIGVRSDHDGLPMVEKNLGLPYISKTNAAHMCGHDGHTTCLLGGMALLMDNIEQIPEDRSVAFIFQPGEEGKGGAGIMVAEGVMDGIDEVYGCHNFPNINSPLKIMVADREMMAHFTIITIQIHGKGGHGSSPEKCNNPIPAAAKAYLAIHEQLNAYQKERGDKMRFSLAAFNAGCACNVIPSSATIKGTFRDFDPKDDAAMQDIIRKVLNEVTSESGTTYEVDFDSPHVGAVINDPTCAGYVRDLAVQFYGAECVGDQGLPVFASEDFSDFLAKAPGCFFFRATKNLPEGSTLHMDQYNFDDAVIDDLSRFWFLLMRARLTAD